MKIFQFIAECCQDLVDAAKIKKKLVDFGDFPHDDVIQDINGDPVPVVLVDGNNIPVSDFITLEKNDFLSAWKTPSASEAFDNYISALFILEGSDVIDRIRNLILAEQEALSKDVDMFMDF